MKNQKKKENKKIEMMFHITVKRVEIFDVTIQNIEGNFELKTQLNKVEKDTLLSLPNPNYHFPDLNNIKLNDIVKKKKLPVHVILGVRDYAKIKMQEKSRIGQSGDLPGLSCERAMKVICLICCFQIHLPRTMKNSALWMYWE